MVVPLLGARRPLAQQAQVVQPRQRCRCSKKVFLIFSAVLFSPVLIPIVILYLLFLGLSKIFCIKYYRWDEDNDCPYWLAFLGVFIFCSIQSTLTIMMHYYSLSLSAQLLKMDSYDDLIYEGPYDDLNTRMA